MRAAVLLTTAIVAAACGRGPPAPAFALAPGPEIAGCPVFPDGSAWNTPLDGQRADPRSAALIAAMSPDAALSLSVGTTETFYGIPYTVVPPSQPPVPIQFGTDGLDFSFQSDPGPFPIPLDAPIQGDGGAEPGDRHLVVVQSGTCELFEAFNAERVPGGFRVSSAARWNLRTGAPRPPGWTSADAAGLPIFPGLLRFEELEAGRIAHALRFTLPGVGGSYVAPANHCVAGSPADPPFGTRVRLRAGFDASPYSPQARVLLEALRRYGLVLADQGSPWAVSGTSHPGFDALLRELREKPILGRDFEVLAPAGLPARCGP